MTRKGKFCFLICLFFSRLCFAQETQTLTLESCEERFLKNNLLLLAEQYNIGAKQALTIQAKAYPNPIFTADFNVYDPQNKKIFHVDSTGQKSFQVQQLILLGGKRRVEIEIAKQNTALAEAEFAELLRSLKSELHQRFYNIGSALVVMNNYQKQLLILDTIIASYKIQTDKGNLPLKDLIRLKSVYLKINSYKSDLATQNNEDQKQLKLLLQTNQDIIPVIPDDGLRKYTELKAIAELQALALSNRPDLQIADQSAILAELNLKREKKQRIPDIQLNGSYDQRGGAFHNQVNAGISLPIPILNTNRGNIKAAEFDKKALDTYLQEKKLEVELDVQQAWANMQRSINEYNKVKELYNEEFTEVNKGVNDNFHLRNISILEFVDFVESYNESLADFESIKKQLVQSGNLVNYVTATKIY
ncbi:MAG: TolC family protein [Bacteroidia bacterium]|nr:TolC family protein [Bacteroidia bacterium]